MRIKELLINNFRQYYSSNYFNFETESDKNIILIGGLNGYGKTNLLISMVWCFYGDKIVNVDNNFRSEIRKKGQTYNFYMNQSLNNSARLENIKEFYVELILTDLNISSFHNYNSGDEIKIKRSFNIDSSATTISIINNTNKLELFIDEEDKINFINDNLLPVDAAKFVFFDGEKISQIADLSVQEQGTFVNDALQNILGLDIYNILIQDLEKYISGLKKEGADNTIKFQIENLENTIKSNDLEISNLEDEIVEINNKLNNINNEINKVIDLIIEKSRNDNPEDNKKDIQDKLTQQRLEFEILKDNFHELSEIIPFIILNKNIVDVVDLLDKQADHNEKLFLNEEYKNKFDLIIEKLFSEPPFPSEDKLTFKDKLFYVDKANGIINNLLEIDYESDSDLDFDLSRSNIKLIKDSLNIVNQQDYNFILDSINRLTATQNELINLENQFNLIESVEVDDIVREYYSKKQDLEKDKSKYDEEKAELKLKMKNFQKDIVSYKERIKTFEGHVAINEINKKKIDIAKKYINTLLDLIDYSKNKQKENFEKSILNELKLLMHKLTSKGFIDKVSVNILAENKGMDITLKDEFGEEVKKEKLSSGEKQIYISCLIKAILKQSTKDLPIFIDTPLGRLDESHRNSITELYYPTLSKQVILFSTDSEITPSRFKQISKYVSKSYRLVNDGKNTKVVDGYF